MIELENQQLSNWNFTGEQTSHVAQVKFEHIYTSSFLILQLHFTMEAMHEK